MLTDNIFVCPTHTDRQGSPLATIQLNYIYFSQPCTFLECKYWLTTLKLIPIVRRREEKRTRALIKMHKLLNTRDLWDSPFIFSNCYRTTPENLLRLKFFSIPPAAALKTLYNGREQRGFQEHSTQNSRQLNPLEAVWNRAKPFMHIMLKSFRKYTGMKLFHRFFRTVEQLFTQEEKVPMKMFVFIVQTIFVELNKVNPCLLCISG